MIVRPLPGNTEVQLDEANEINRNVLRLVVYLESVEIRDAISDRREDVNLVDRDGLTPLLEATEQWVDRCH